MPNTHLVPDMASEVQAICSDLLPAVILSTTWPIVPVTSLTLAAFATHGYVRDGANLVYVNQAAAPVTLSGADGNYWLALHRNTSSAVSLWTRQPGTHYLWRSNATLPADPAGGLVLALVTVAGGIITAVNVALTISSVNRVAVGNATGQMSYDPQLVWDATLKRLGILTATPGAALEVAGNAIVSGGMAVDTNTLVVDNVNGRVGILQANPAAALDVQGNTLLQGSLVVDNTTLIVDSTLHHVGISVAPTANAMLRVEHPKNSATGLITKGTDTDAGAFAALTFLNVAGSVVGTIQATAAATAFNTSSDARLKSAVQALDNALAAVLALRPVRFRWNADGSQGQGFLAHELQAVIPDAVSGEPDAVNPDGSIRPQGVDHSRLVVFLVGALQELAARVDALEAAQP